MNPNSQSTENWRGACEASWGGCPALHVRCGYYVHNQIPGAL